MHINIVRHLIKREQKIILQMIKMKRRKRMRILIRMQFIMGA